MSDCTCLSHNCSFKSVVVWQKPNGSFVILYSFFFRFLNAKHYIVYLRYTCCRLSVILNNTLAYELRALEMEPPTSWAKIYICFIDFRFFWPTSRAFLLIFSHCVTKDSVFHSCFQFNFGLNWHSDLKFLNFSDPGVYWEGIYISPSLCLPFMILMLCLEIMFIPAQLPTTVITAMMKSKNKARQTRKKLE